MKNFTIALAGKRIAVSSLFDSTRDFCAEYLAEGEPDFSVAISPDDIAFEREKSAMEDAMENIPTRHFSDAYLETLAVYRKIANQMLSHETLLFHGSAIAVDGEGYLFTAMSGTGKSTHTRLWRNMLGDRAVMVNDDKPLLRFMDDGVWVCGTPWNGKHHLGTNIMVPLKGISIIERGETDVITQLTPEEALPMLMQQSHRPADPVDMVNMLTLLDRLMQSVKFYRLQCTMNPNAAVVAFEGMKG